MLSRFRLLLKVLPWRIATQALLTIVYVKVTILIYVRFASFEYAVNQYIPT